MDSNHRSRSNRFTVCPLWPLGNSSKKISKQFWSCLENGAGGRTRTPDLLITNQLLYQLSYTSLNLIFCYRFKRLLHSNTRSSICQQDFLLFTNCSHSLFFCLNFAENEWRGRQDSNLRHLGPKPSTLPNWVTPRIQLNHYTAFRYRLSILNFKQISENIQRCFVYFGTNRAK